MRQRALFPADRGLQVRMVLAAVLTPAVVLAALVACALVLPLKLLIGLAAVSAVGVVVTVRDLRREETCHLLRPSEHPELQAIVHRLCVLADLPEPEIAIDDCPDPNSWVVDPPGRRPRLHVTTGLLRLLDDAELEAVIAHELSHVGHRDATVMTVVGLPGTTLLSGSRRGMGGFWILVVAQAIARAIGYVALVGISALSRYRELTADAGAARLTGRPSALASALMKVSGGMHALPTEDLRVAANRNAFNFLPAAVERWRVFATHPSLECRLHALERLEDRLQHGRRP